MRVLQYLSELRQDAAFSIRQMFAAPAFSVLAIATLALGIGATTAIFSAVHAVVLRPLPVPDPDRLVVVNSGWREGVMSMAPAHYVQLAEDQAAFQAIAALERTNFTLAFTLAREEGAERVIGARVTGQFFDVFRVPPAIGRVFGPSEDEPGRDRIVVLSHRIWTRQFGADAGILGRDITLNQRPHTVIGVMPPSFELSTTAEELWVPMGSRRSARRCGATISSRCSRGCATTCPCSRRPRRCARSSSAVSSVGRTNRGSARCT